MYFVIMVIQAQEALFLSIRLELMNSHVQISTLTSGQKGSKFEVGKNKVYQGDELYQLSLSADSYFLSFCINIKTSSMF